MIKKTKELIQLYPYHNNYSLYPGPNSNTFIQYIIDNLKLDIVLLPNAFGKGFNIVQSRNST